MITIIAQCLYAVQFSTCIEPRFSLRIRTMESTDVFLGPFSVVHLHLTFSYDKIRSLFNLFHEYWENCSTGRHLSRRFGYSWDRSRALLWELRMIRKWPVVREVWSVVGQNNKGIIRRKQASTRVSVVWIFSFFIQFDTHNTLNNRFCIDFTFISQNPPKW